MSRGVAWSGLLIASLACGGGLPSTPLSRTWTVQADRGGHLALATGSWVDIPAGALAADTVITLTQVAPDRSGGGAVAALVVEPHDLVLALPARVAVAYDPATVEDESSLSLAVTSTQHAYRHVGSEFTLTEARADVVRDLDANTVGVDVAHFSIFHLFEHPDVFVGRDIPAKFLKKGDILYAMTDAAAHTEASTFPLHVGLMLRPLDGTVIEATIEQQNCNTYARAVEPHPLDGYNGFRNLCGTHVYLGARRPSGWTEAIGSAAADYAWGKVGTPYGLAGLSPVTGFGGISCVELAEDGYEEAGVNISLMNDVTLTPYMQYINTWPVRMIDVDPAVDREVRIPIVAAVRTADNTYSAAGWDGDRPRATLEITASSMNPSARATFESYDGRKNRLSDQALGEVVFRPGPADADKDVVFDAVIRSGSFTWKDENFLQFRVGAVKAGTCPWQDKPASERTFVGKITGEAGGKPFSRDDVPLVLSPSGGALWVNFDTSAVPGDIFAFRPRDHGWVQISAYPAAKDFTAGTSPGYTLDRGPIDPGASGRLGGSTTFQCGEDALSPDSGSVRFELAPDCRSVGVTIDAKASLGGASCELKARYEGVAR